VLTSITKISATIIIHPRPLP